MLLVRTRLALSTVQGLGLFADQFIPRGTLVWTYHEGFDQSFTIDALAVLPHAMRQAICHYSYQCEGGEWVLCADDARFMNHADPANTADGEHGTVATCDIAAGEEITCNYFEFDLAAAGKLGTTPG